MCTYRTPAQKLNGLQLHIHCKSVSGNIRAVKQAGRQRDMQLDEQEEKQASEKQSRQTRSETAWKEDRRKKNSSTWCAQAVQWTQHVSSIFSLLSVSGCRSISAALKVYTHFLQLQVDNTKKQTGAAFGEANMFQKHLMVDRWNAFWVNRQTKLHKLIPAYECIFCKQL